MPGHHSARDSAQWKFALHNGSTFSCDAQPLSRPAEAPNCAARRYHGPRGWASAACNVWAAGSWQPVNNTEKRRAVQKAKLATPTTTPALVVVRDDYLNLLLSLVRPPVYDLAKASMEEVLDSSGRALTNRSQRWPRSPAHPRMTAKQMSTRAAMRLPLPNQQLASALPLRRARRRRDITRGRARIGQESSGRLVVWRVTCCRLRTPYAAEPAA